MDERTSREKGDALESAVAAIEHAILLDSEHLAKETFIIETKKIVKVGGVRHEFDVWVQLPFAHGYDPIFVFECKNWNSKVGKNEIIVFAEKVDAVSAAKGYFVATAYTEDAKAQAEKHTRLRLLLASEVHFTTPVPVAMPIVCRQQPHQANFTVKWWDVEGKNIRQLDRPTVTLNGKTSSFEAFFQPLAQEALNAAFDNFDDRGKEEGIYDTSAEMTEEYPRGVLFI